MALGIYPFGDITRDPHTGRAISVSQRYAEIIAAAKLADEAAAMAWVPEAIAERGVRTALKASLSLPRTVI